MPDNLLTRSLWPDYEIADYSEQLAELIIANDVYEGTSRLAACGETYLPKFPLEEPDDYKKRLANTVLFNMHERTVAALVGMVFRKNPVLADDVPDSIKADWENIDLEGTHGDVFLRELFTWAIVDGHDYLFIDAPPSVRNSIKGRKATYEDQLKSGNRPYWCIRRKRDVLNWRIKNVRGRRVVTQVTMREWVHQDIGTFGENIYARYRVLRPGYYEVWEALEPDSRAYKKGQLFKVVEQGQTDLNYIPLYPIYTRRKQQRMMVSSPMLMSIVHENLLHYRLSSDYHNILHYANVPILATVNEMDDGISALGAAVKLKLSKDGDAKWVEHSGSAVEHARTEILDTEMRVAKLGLAALAPKGDVEQTATEQLLDVAAESSELAGAARNLEDGAESGLMTHAELRNEKMRKRDKKTEGGSLRLNDEFVHMILDTAKLAVYDNMVTTRKLSLETFWKILVKHGDLPPDFSEADEQERIKANIINFPSADAGPIDIRSTSGNPADNQGKGKVKNKDVMPAGKAGPRKRAA
jgi:Domain of unknown function (DUF4055)